MQEANEDSLSQDNKHELFSTIVKFEASHWNALISKCVFKLLLVAFIIQLQNLYIDTYIFVYTALYCIIRTALVHTHTHTHTCFNLYTLYSIPVRLAKSMQASIQNE